MSPYRMDAEFEADLINGRACASCGGGITPEDRVPHGGFWLCMPGCVDDDDEPAANDIAQGVDNPASSLSAPSRNDPQGQS